MAIRPHCPPLASTVCGKRSFKIIYEDRQQQSYSAHMLRAPYYPIGGAIDYVFNTLQTRLRLRMPYVVSTQTLRQELIDGIRSITTCVPYFEHVGFWNTE